MHHALSQEKEEKKNQVNWKNSSLLTWTTMHIQIWIPPLILGCEWLFCQRLSPMVRGQPIWAHTTPRTNTQWHHIFLLSLYHKKSIACLPQRGRSEKCICVPFFFSNISCACLSANWSATCPFFGVRYACRCMHVLVFWCILLPQWKGGWWKCQTIIW